MAFNHSFFTSAKNMKIVHFVLKSCTFRFRDYISYHEKILLQENPWHALPCLWQTLYLFGITKNFHPFINRRYGNRYKNKTNPGAKNHCRQPIVR